MKIEQLLAEKIRDRAAARLIPPAIVADVLVMAMAALESLPFPEGLSVVEVLAEEWATCDECEELVRVDLVVHDDGDGDGSFCEACWQKFSAAKKPARIDDRVIED